MPLMKLLLRFKTRFSELKDLVHGRSLGGKTVRNIPSCRIAYPSHGIGDSCRGILSIYLFNEEAMNMISISDPAENNHIVLRDLQTLYPEVNINSSTDKQRSSTEVISSELHIASILSQNRIHSTEMFQV